MRKYKKYSSDRLNEAIRQVQRGQMSATRASRLYGVPRSTIESAKDRKGHPVRCLTLEEEQSLVNYIKYCSKRAFPLNSKMIRAFAREIIKRSGRKTTVGPNGPSRKWFAAFMKRHLELSMRKCDIIDGGRVAMSNENVLRQHFSLLEETVNKLDISDKPERIYNCDESGFGKMTRTCKVCVEKGKTHPYSKSSMFSTHTTLHMCICADGSHLPPFVIYESSFQSGQYREGIPRTWLFAKSPNGYMDSELFLSWFQKIFLRHCRSERPVLLTMDNHESHLTLDLIDIAKTNDVELFALPPHTTHLLQPLDVGVFRPIKSKFNDICGNLAQVNNQQIVGKNRVAQVLSSSLDQVMTSHLLKESFRKTGMYPINSGEVDRSRIIPADTQIAEAAALSNDLLCETCGQFVGVNPLVAQGLVPAELQQIFVPIIGKSKVEKKSRVVTEARVLTGDEMIKILTEKEKQKKTKEGKKNKGGKKTKGGKKNKSKEQCVQQPIQLSQENDDAETGKRKCQDTVPTDMAEDELPTLSRPKPRTKKAKLDDPKYTCGECGVRGYTDDEERGITWVGCDGQCERWYHYDCMVYGTQLDVDFSIITGGEWFCDDCNCCDDSLSRRDRLCEVCMLGENVDSFWVECRRNGCERCFHYDWLPGRVQEQWSSMDARGMKWVCSVCPEH